MNQTRRLSVSLRESKIADMLQESQEVSIPDLASMFGVSEMTIRRDLDRLERKGRARRTHGGAIPTEKMVFEFDFVTRRRAHRRAKLGIATEAAKFVHPGQTIIIDAGTTTLELAQLLKACEGLTVITPSLAVASELQFCQGIETVLLGGVVRKGSPDLTGMVTEAVLDMFKAEIAFQGADGLDLDGAMYTNDMRISRVDERIRTRARQTYVLADSSKIGKTALARHGLLQEVHALITDDGIAPADKAQLEKLGIKMIVVPAES